MLLLLLYSCYVINVTMIINLWLPFLLLLLLAFIIINVLQKKRTIVVMNLRILKEKPMYMIADG